MLLTIQLLASFFIGGLFIALQTLVAERVHGIWRNIALAIPSTSALGILFVGLVKSPIDAAEAALIIPAALTPDYLFVFIFAALTSFGVGTRIVLSLLAWSVGAWLILLYPPETFFASAAIYALPFILLFYWFTRKLPKEGTLKIFPMTAGSIAVRSLIGGAIISLVVILSQTLGNVWGGLFSAFPATFLSTFIIYNRWQGRHVIPKIATALFFPGSLGFILYSWVAALAFPLWGVWLGTLAAYAAIGIFYLVWISLSYEK